MIRLANPSFLLMGVTFLLPFFKRKVAFLGYSRLDLLEGEKNPRFWHHLPGFLTALAIALMVLGLARPQWKDVVRQKSFLARDILLIMDLSSSMDARFHLGEGPRKIDVARSAAAQFIEKRENDRVGLLVFGDETFGSWPLTADLKLILKKVDRLGSTFYGGTNLAKPFVKAMDHFREMGQSENRILVYLSDGEASIHREVREEIIASLKKMNIHLYLVGVQLRKEGSDILEIVQRVGGRFIDVESSAELSAAFEEIDRLEPSLVEVAVRGESQELYPLCVFSALCILVGLTLLRNTLFIELC
jgi:Ca-activated chloride channel family protein